MSFLARSGNQENRYPSRDWGGGRCHEDEGASSEVSYSRGEEVAIKRTKRKEVKAAQAARGSAGRTGWRRPERLGPSRHFGLPVGPEAARAGEEDRLRCRTHEHGPYAEH